MKKDKNASTDMTGYASIDRPWLKYYDKNSIDKEIPKKTLYRYAVESNANNGNGIAINYYGFKCSFKRFFREVDKIANAFTALGVKEGDFITICSASFPETIFANFALNKIGAIANNVDPRSNASRIEESINKVQSDYMIMLDIAYPKVNSIIKNTNIKKIFYISYMEFVPWVFKGTFKKKLVVQLATSGLKIPDIPTSDIYIPWQKFLKYGKGIKSKEAEYVPDRIAALVRTGGTTGEPKAVALTNDSAVSLVENYKATDLGLEKGQSLLNIIPGFSSYGWTFGTVMATCLGIENIIIPQFDVKDFADYFIKYKPNHIVGVPAFYTHLIDEPKMQNIDFSNFLTSISAGGDLIFEEDEKRVNDFLHEHGFKHNLIVGYGLSECNASVATRLNKCNVVGSVGIPLVNNTISIFRIQDNEESLGTDEELKYGEYGEICVTGSSQMLGYYKDEANTKKIQIMHRDGRIWTHTRDIGYMDKDGNIYPAGRLKRSVARPDGHKVWPSEIEKVILKHKYVKACCVVGIPSAESTQGEYPTALVVLEKNCNKRYLDIEQELRELCLLNLPDRDVAYAYVFGGEIPLTNNGKVDFEQVRKLIINHK